MSVEFEDYSIKVKTALKEAGIAFLEEAGGEIEAQTKKNCAVVTGQTKGSFSHAVDENTMECGIGSDYENAIWEELGTGIYAFNGDGRKTPWAYYDAQGVRHITQGKKPKRMLFNAFQSLQGKIQKVAEERFGELN